MLVRKIFRPIFPENSTIYILLLKKVTNILSKDNFLIDFFFQFSVLCRVLFSYCTVKPFPTILRVYHYLDNHLRSFAKYIVTASRSFGHINTPNLHTGYLSTECGFFRPWCAKTMHITYFFRI